MYARMTTIEVRLDKFDDAISIYKKSVIPAAKLQKGYCQAFLLTDRKTGKGISLSLWETEEDALANEKNKYYQTQLVKFIALFTADPVREGYEVTFQDSNQ